MNTPLDEFRSPAYLTHNKARINFWQQLMTYCFLDRQFETALELGGGVGDHTCFTRGLARYVTVVEGRPENVAFMRQRFVNDLRISVFERDLSIWEPASAWDVVYSGGILYHLADPEKALHVWSRACGSLFLLETCVCPDKESIVKPFREDLSPSSALDGLGCRPSRLWLWERLGGLYKHVYVPWAQPDHEEFPLDWSDPGAFGVGLTRATFVASRFPIENTHLSGELPTKQERFG